jgi:hypothetical protein
VIYSGCSPQNISSPHDQTTNFAAAVAHGDADAPQIRKRTRSRASVDAVIRKRMIADVQRVCELFRPGIVPVVWRAGCRSRSIRTSPVTPEKRILRSWTSCARLAARTSLSRLRRRGQVPCHHGARAGYRWQRDTDLLGAAVSGGHCCAHKMLERAFTYQCHADPDHLRCELLRLAVRRRGGPTAEKIGTDDALVLRGMTGVANSRLAHQARDTFAGPRWNEPAAKSTQTLGIGESTIHKEIAAAPILNSTLRATSLSQRHGQARAAGCPSRHALPGSASPRQARKDATPCRRHR